MINLNPHKSETGRVYNFASVILTIGCNVGPVPTWTPAQVVEATREQLPARYLISNHHVTIGEWDGIEETSVSVMLAPMTAHDFERLEKHLQALCVTLKQDAIGVWDIRDNSALVWNPERRQAEKTA